MKFTTASAATALLATGQLANADILKLPISRAPHPSTSPGKQSNGPVRLSPLSKRAAITESLLNNATGGSYYASVVVGTPGQPQSLVLDTGSSDAFVVQSDADLCSSARLQEEAGYGCGSTYDSSKSSSYKLVTNGGFKIQYLDGSGAAGDYITEDLSIGGVTVNGLQMGSANQTETGIGILGIGFDADESTKKTYPNLIDTLVSQGAIGAKAYSLYLDDYSASSGSIIFGGVDTAKFSGTLVVLPIQPDAQSGTISSFTVSLSGASIAFANGTKFTVPAISSLPSVLDSGTTLAYLPDANALPLLEAVGAVLLQQGEGASLAVIDCGQATGQSSPTMLFQFGDAAIQIPASELIFENLSDEVGGQAGELPFAQTCVFGIQPLGDSEQEGSGGGDGGDGGDGGFKSSHLHKRQSSGPMASFGLLGDTFLRSAYVVYDLDHKQIGLAQSSFNSDSSNVVELVSSASALQALKGGGAASSPSSVAASAQPTVTAASSLTSAVSPHIPVPTTTSGSAALSSDAASTITQSSMSVTSPSSASSTHLSTSTSSSLETSSSSPASNSTTVATSMTSSETSASMVIVTNTMTSVAGGSTASTASTTSTSTSATSSAGMSAGVVNVPSCWTSLSGLGLVSALMLLGAGFLA